MPKLPHGLKVHDHVLSFSGAHHCSVNNRSLAVAGCRLILSSCTGAIERCAYMHSLILYTGLVRFFYLRPFIQLFFLTASSFSQKWRRLLLNCDSTDLHLHHLSLLVCFSYSTRPHPFCFWMYRHYLRSPFLTLPSQRLIFGYFCNIFNSC